MKRQWKPLLCLVLAALTLSSCAGQPTQQPFTAVTQNLGPNVATPSPGPVQNNGQGSGVSGSSIFSANPYDVSNGDEVSPLDAMGEEDIIDPNLNGDGTNYDTAAAAGTVYPYAGTTPVPLDPIDMPSPTPRPALSFTYVPYTASFGGAGNAVSFEAPAGWLVDEGTPEVFTLTEPSEQIKENQQCIVTLSAIPVTSNYSEANLKTEVKQRLTTIGAVNFTSWKPSSTATRHLMGSNGVYANYSGTLADGTQLGGRIHYVCIDKVLFSVEIVYPLGYKDDYLNVFAKVRETIKRVK